LPCGHQLSKNTARAKKIALSIKDRSVKALQVLALLAQQDKDHKKAILYKLEIIKRGKELPPKCMLEIAQNCGVVKVYPDEVIEYLEAQRAAGNIEALQALGGIALGKQQFERAVTLLTEAIKLGSPSEAEVHLELAYTYIAPNWPERNVEKAVEHLVIGARALRERGVDSNVAADHIEYFPMQLIKLLVIAQQCNDEKLKAQVIKALADVVDLMQETRFYSESSVEWHLTCATNYSMHGFENWMVVKSLAEALKLINEQYLEIDIDNISVCVTLIVFRIHEDMRKAEKANDHKLAATFKANLAFIVELIRRSPVSKAFVLPKGI